MRALLEATGLPLAAPSANASGAISPTRAEHVFQSIGGRIPMIVDDGPTELGLESTIVGLATATVSLLRPGPITRERIEAVVGPVSLHSGNGPITAPGQLASHYAPSKPLRLNASAAGADEWLIGFGTISGHANLSPAGNLIEAAASLFDFLHQADASPFPKIAAAPVPDEGLGEAINDRLRRAAT
jgi:L-threonylcarbamoyladenylate synthase